MNERQKQLFTAVIREHIHTAKPVGSAVLVEKYGLNVSPATVRNDMMELEKNGFLTHPHTSAGRIPTEKGYKYYIENFIPKHDTLSDQEKQDLTDQQETDPEKSYKSLAKKIADITDETVIVGFSKDDIYYTGIAHLFQKPEFAQLETLYSISEVVDHLDEAIPRVFNNLKSELEVLIGTDNPISEDCAMVVGTMKRNDNTSSIICIVGPMRMDYEYNISTIQYIQENLSHKR